MVVSGGALLTNPYSVYVTGNYAYVASFRKQCTGNCEYIDPAAPFHTGSIAGFGSGGAPLKSPHSVYVSGNLAYIASFGSNYLEIVNITNPAAPVPCRVSHVTFRQPAKCLRFR